MFLDWSQNFNIFHLTKTKTIWKKVCIFGCQSCFWKPFFVCFSLKKLIYDFWAGNNYPDSPHSQGVGKFATQISPLLNFILLARVAHCKIHNPVVSLLWLLEDRTMKYFLHSWIRTKDWKLKSNKKLELMKPCFKIKL